MKLNGPTSRLSGDCAVEGCDRPLFRQGLCGSHFKRRQRRQIVNVPIGNSVVDGGLSNCEVLSTEEICIIAGSTFLESGTDDEYRYCRRKFLKTMEKWMESRGWTPPRKKKGRR